MEKISSTFFFDRLLVNNVSATALLHGDHIVMRIDSLMCTVQNQRFTLQWNFYSGDTIGTEAVSPE